MKKQFELFGRWKLACNKLSELSAVIQNDFNFILKDEHISHNHIAHMRLAFNYQVHNQLIELNSIKKEIMDLLKVVGNVTEEYHDEKLNNFSVALEAVKEGKSIQRLGWNEKGLHIKAQYPDEFSKMTLPYLYIEYPPNHPTTPNAKCPWLASQTDIMALDWVVLDMA